MRAYAVRHDPEFTERIAQFLRLGGARYLTILLALFWIGCALELERSQAHLRLDQTQKALVDRLDDLDRARQKAELSKSLLRQSRQGYPPLLQKSYLVISISDRRLWYREEGEVLLTTSVATGSGKTLPKEQGDSLWKFDTPRGRLVVESKEEKPLWVPPDWFYVEHAHKKKLKLMHLQRGQAITQADGSVVKVVGADVVRQYPDGRSRILKASEEHDIVIGGRLLVPPLDTNQRRFDKVLGTHRLNLGHGYALHGTNHPDSVGQAVSHGCVRLKNEDIARLYQMVPVGTPVYLY